MQKRLIFFVVLFALLWLSTTAVAGDLEPDAPPGSTMHTLDEIFQKLAILDALSKTADQVCNGQTFIGLQDDGTIGEMVGTSPCACGERFLENGDGTVTDCVTGLVWLVNGSSLGYLNWNEAVVAIANLADGQCGLSDGSVAGDWRIPTKEELQGVGTNPPTTWAIGLPPVNWTSPETYFLPGIRSSTWYNEELSLLYAVALNTGNTQYDHISIMSIPGAVRAGN